jgi:aryl hydrocarbon receptor nuclear translocator
MPGCSDLASPPSQFTMRISPEGKVTFVDQRVAALLGLATTDLVGRFWWKLVHPADQGPLQDAFAELMADRQLIVQTRLQAQHEYVTCSVSAYKFLNPYSEELEYIVANHQVGYLVFRVETREIS